MKVAQPLAWIVPHFSVFVLSCIMHVARLNGSSYCLSVLPWIDLRHLADHHDGLSDPELHFWWISGRRNAAVMDPPPQNRRILEISFPPDIRLLQEFRLPWVYVSHGVWSLLELCLPRGFDFHELSYLIFLSYIFCLPRVSFPPGISSWLGFHLSPGFRPPPKLRAPPYPTPRRPCSSSCHTSFRVDGPQPKNLAVLVFGPTRRVRGWLEMLSQVSSTLTMCILKLRGWIYVTDL